MPTVAICLPQVYKTTVGQQNKVATAGHSITINLRLDVGDRCGICFEPCNVYFNIEVADAEKN